MRTIFPRDDFLSSHQLIDWHYLTLLGEKTLWSHLRLNLRSTQLWPYDWVKTFFCISLIYQGHDMHFKITSGALLAVLLCLSLTSHLVRARSLRGKLWYYLSSRAINWILRQVAGFAIYFFGKELQRNWKISKLT